MRKNYHAKFEPERCYHVYNRCVGGLQLFTQDKNYHYFLDRYWHFLNKYTSTYAYALIPNHFHFLIKCKQPDATILKHIEKENTVKAIKYLEGELSYHDFLADQFKRFFCSYVTKFNSQENRHGTLLQAKFKRIPIENVEHFKFMVLYHHHNGIHHKMGKDYKDWPFTSFNQYLNNTNDHLAKKIVFQLFENEQESSLSAFLKFHKEHKHGLGGYPNLVKYRDLTMDYQ